jgi:hypothetical protein
VSLVSFAATGRASGRFRGSPELASAPADAESFAATGRASGRFRGSRELASAPADASSAYKMLVAIP